MSDQQQPKPSPFDQQMVDPKFQSLSYDDQKTERAKLYDKLMSNDPKWASTPADQQIQAFNAVRDGKPPAFIDPKYEKLRTQLEDPTQPLSGLAKFSYDAGTQMGITGLVPRGVANIVKGVGPAIDNTMGAIDHLFGGAVKPDDTNQLFMRAIAGDKDGVKLAQYLQHKYEKPLNAKIPLIGGQTPSQLLGSALGYGTDFAMMRGPVKLAEQGIGAATELLKPVVKTAARLASTAAVTGTLGVVRGAVAAGTNAIGGALKAPVEGAIDFAHGLGETVKSVGSIWGQWALQDLAFGILRTGVGVGITKVLGATGRAITGVGTKALPKPEMFEKTADGVYTPRAEALRRQFVAGNAHQVARDQLGPVAKDWGDSLDQVVQYAKDDSNAVLNNPVAAMRTRAQLFSGGDAPLGIATVSDGPGTWRIRQALGKGGAVLGEHQSLPEAEMTINREWQSDIDTTRDNLSKWTARQEKAGGIEDERQVLSAQMRLKGLEDSHPLDRQIRDSQQIINGSMDRLAPEGSARLPHEGSMLTYGEVGALQGNRMRVAKVQFDLAGSDLEGISKRGVLAPTDMPTRIPTTSSGDFNGAIVYSKAAPENVFQATVQRFTETANREASAEHLAYSDLRGQGFDAIQHANGDMTALYPREQIKHVTDFVNKTSREYITPEARPSVAASVEARGPAPTAYAAPEMLSSARDKADWLMEAARREGGAAIQALPSGDYVLNMQGQAPFRGDLASVTDQFLARSTTPTHLRASLESEGMKLSFDGKQYRISDSTGHVTGVGESPQAVMQAAGYRPRLIDGRFGPQNVEVLPEGSPFTYSAQGVSGTMADIYKFNNGFMDVAEEEGKRTVASTKDGHVSEGHDAAFTVEIPSWGIREKFGSGAEARAYLGGEYKTYDNAQRLANERGLALTYESGKGYVLNGPTGTFTAKTMEDVGKVLARTPDPRWAPGGQFDAGTTLKNSRDAIKLPSDTEPRQKTFEDRNAVAQAILSAKTWISKTLMPARFDFSGAEKTYGLKGLSKSFADLQDGVKTGANQTFLDIQKVQAIRRMYNLNGHEEMIVDKVMQALGPDAKEKVLEDFGIAEGDKRRPQIMDAAARLKSEFYDPMYTRTGQDPNAMLVDYASKHHEYKQRNPYQYQDMELSGPDGMRQLIEATNGNRVPDDMKFSAVNERVADMDGLLKEENAFSKAALYAQTANRWAYAVEPMKAFIKRLYQGDIKDPRIINMGRNFIEQALNMGQGDAMDILRSMGKEGHTSASFPLASYIKQAMGMGLWGFKPGSALTIIEHGYIPATAYLGTDAVNHGFRITGEGGTAHLEKNFRKGVFTGRVPIGQGFGDTSTGSNWFASGFAKLSKASSFFVQNAHIIAKSAVYDGASWLFDKHMKPWFDAGKVIEADTKLHDVKGYLLDKGAQDIVKQHLDEGSYEAAKHAYAMNMTDIATYQWRPEDQGAALNKGQVAKMYGQLMIVPTHYTAALARLASAGSFADRVANLATFSKNTAAFYGASRAAGMSGSNLLPWQVMTLRGGPMWQAVVNLTQSNPGKKELDLALKTLSTMPPVAQVKQAIQVVKEFQAGHPWAGMLTLLGRSVRPDLAPPKR